jgi:hypothetical protein
MLFMLEVRAFWDVAPCSLGVVPTFQRCVLPPIIALMLEAVCTSETSVYSDTTWCYISEGSNPHTHPMRTWNLTFMLFMSMGWNYVSEVRPPACLLFIPQVIYEYAEPWWNDIGKETNELVQNPSQSHFIRLKSHEDWPRHQPRPLQLVINHLSHGTAFVEYYIVLLWMKRIQFLIFFFYSLKKASLWCHDVCEYALNHLTGFYEFVWSCQYRLPHLRMS